MQLDMTLGKRDFHRLRERGLVIVVEQLQRKGLAHGHIKALWYFFSFYLPTTDTQEIFLLTALVRHGKHAVREFTTGGLLPVAPGLRQRLNTV
jgi:hypothetical protein